ncbi:hypothetical protein ACM26V_15450 [Salipaludibacillus sp. HK11]|uniref:hypothetical protein n=1 Tax=Salipaludibacillus sp. HK11 TaxID=3394320 RepID=UPI0039FC34C9
MKELHSRYAIGFNKEHHYISHLLQGRYGAKVMGYRCLFCKSKSLYHLNPVEASIVRHPENYRWNSYKAYILGMTIGQQRKFLPIIMLTYGIFSVLILVSLENAEGW